MIVDMKENQQATLKIALLANPVPGQTANQPANADGAPVWALVQDPGGCTLTPAADGLSALFVPGPIPAGTESISAVVSATADAFFGDGVNPVVENFPITVHAIPVEFIQGSVELALRPQAA